jgi:hypothetical protein
VRMRTRKASGWRRNCGRLVNAKQRNKDYLRKSPSLRNERPIKLLPKRSVKLKRRWRKSKRA